MEKVKEINAKYAMIAELKQYLTSTDYHVIKLSEGGYIIPQNILMERHAARENINALENEIEEIELIQNDENTITDIE
jgi:hypothetical protein